MTSRYGTLHDERIAVTKVSVPVLATDVHPDAVVATSEKVPVPIPSNPLVNCLLVAPAASVPLSEIVPLTV